MTTPEPLELSPEETTLLDEMVRFVGAEAINIAHPLIVTSAAEVRMATRRARKAPTQVALRLGLDERLVRRQLNAVRKRHELGSYLDLCWCHSPA
jgi:hypothetical protein